MEAFHVKSDSIEFTILSPLAADAVQRFRRAMADIEKHGVYLTSYAGVRLTRPDAPVIDVFPAIAAS